MLRLARVGALHEDDLVRGPSDEAFGPAGRHPLLHDAFDEDPWAAWDDLADEDPEEVWAAVATREDEPEPEDVDDPPTVDPAPTAEAPEEITLQPEPVSVSTEPESVAPDALQQEPAPTMKVALVAPTPKKRKASKKRARSPGAAPPTLPERVVLSGGNARAQAAEVIDFPGQQVQVTLPPEITATPLPVELAGSPPGDAILDIPRDGEPGFQPLRVAILAGPFLVGLLFLMWWVPHTATLGLGAVDERELAALVAELEPPVEEAEPERPADVYDALLSELHGRMADGAVDVEGDDGLETALLIELSRMGLDIQSVKAEVKTWAGPKKNPIPEDVEIRVTLNTRGEIERELASVGLVVGKYVLHYGLNADLFEVRLSTPGGATRVRALNANAAARLYGGRSDLVTFLLDKPE